MRFFRDRAFSAANGASLFMYFGMFGSIFLLTQFFQTAQGYSPLEAGLRVLPWTAMPMVVAPIAGALSDRIGGGRSWPRASFLQAAGPRVDRVVSTGDVGYDVARRPLHPLRHRHGDVLRARSRTSSSPPSGRSRRARPRARTTRSARSEASSASRSSPRSSRTTAATSRPRALQRRPRGRDLGRRGGRRRWRAPRAPHPAARSASRTRSPRDFVAQAEAA